MKLYQSIVLMAFLGYQSTTALSLDYKPDKDFADDQRAFLADEQRASERDHYKREVKAAKEHLELEQLKKDTEKSLMNV